MRKLTCIPEVDYKKLKADRDALSTLVNRAEGALGILAEWYCADVGCKRCRVKRGCDAPQRVQDAAYEQAVEDERADDWGCYKHVRGGEVWWDDDPDDAE